ncbi:MAG: hypothetical protein J0H29_11645 [Sphingobacteriales bacterium]|nr:hypothetical protein [Sphingobacteriales bacterium]OJY85749.1 MAG: hypothetical protein BGP14_17570 [Sphingobacteriales bacterium 44-15]
MKRRNFIKKSGLATGSLLFSSGALFSKTLAPGDPVHNIPADKGLDPAWIRSLYERGAATTYLKSKNELKYIGMPAGGLHAGTVYLGGDGRLWLWGIYNDEREGIDPKTILWNDGAKEVKVRCRDGACYVEPALADNKRVLEQDFAVKIEYEGKTIIKALNENSFDEIKFEASYPVATVHYIDEALPVNIILKAGAIFIPLDADNSALPATVFSISIENKTNKSIKADITGWLENGANKITAAENDGIKRNTAIIHENYTSILGSFDATKPGAAQQRDAGTTCITFIGQGATVNTNAQPYPVDVDFFHQRKDEVSTISPGEKLTGSISIAQHIEPGKTVESNYIISWHFDHPLSKRLDKLSETKGGYYYGKRFKDAHEAGAYIAQNFKELYTQTLLWQETYYDSTLPFWFLERTLLNIGTLATANTYRFADDRFWGWEGVNACEGTCTHVWQYAQAMGRIFPSLERDARQRTDLGIALQENGGIIFRAEYETRPAIDGQAGTILRIYREHQMSSDDGFLRNNWSNIKKAVSFMLSQDKNGDGMTDTPMENTLDAVWEGEIAWIAGLCIAAAKAAQLMAEEMRDEAFAKTCTQYVEKGSRNMAEKLFNGEYFIHRPDAAQGRKKLGSYNTCHVDQVYGQSWAWQVGLGRLWDKEKTISALRSLWKYNFAPDVGPYIKTHTGGRPYALPGEAGLIMNTNPHNEPRPYGENVTWQLGYFHECMTGFEHQVASHMMAEGMTDEALVITRAIHDRYHAAKRNPYNEIECSDHYARAMASYGTFITACGFEYHGPKGYLRFAPKWNRDKFKTAFTSAEGWGAYSQVNNNDEQQHTLTLKYGSLLLNKLSFDNLRDQKIKSVSVKLNGQEVRTGFKEAEGSIVIRLINGVRIKAGEEIQISIS